MSKERWKDVLGYDGCYIVSNLGRVKNKQRVVSAGRARLKVISERLLKPASTRKGYLKVQLSVHGKALTWFVHQLVLRSFVGPCPLGKEARHLNGNPKDNRLKNLKWGTPIQNQQDKRRHGTLLCGVAHYASKLSARQVLKFRAMYSTGAYSIQALAKMCGVARGTLQEALRGHSWKHIKNSVPLSVRGPTGGGKGSSHPGSKLTDAKVRTIRTLYESGSSSVAQLSVVYGVSKGVLYRILRRCSWRHVK